MYEGVQVEKKLFQLVKLKETVGIQKSTVFLMLAIDYLKKKH